MVKKIIALTFLVIILSSCFDSKQENTIDNNDEWIIIEQLNVTWDWVSAEWSSWTYDVNWGFNN